MHICCKNCKNIKVIHFQKNLSTFQKIKSKCVICLTERRFIDKIDDKYDLQSELETYLHFFVY